MAWTPATATTATTAARSPSIETPRVLDVGGCRVFLRFDGVTPHRFEVLHSVPAHGPEPSGPQWVLQIRPLESLGGPQAEEHTFDGFSIDFSGDAPRTAILYVDPARRKKELDAAIGAALYMVLRREARLDLHAAAVTPGADRGAVVIVGAKGVGKSSLTLSLAGAGWRFLSDDYVLAWRRDAEVRLGCLRSSLYFTPDAVERLQGDRPAGRAVARMGKRMFDPEELFPGLHVVEDRLAAVVFPERVESGGSSLIPIRPVEAFQRILALTPFLAADPSARPCIEVARAIADLPSFVLRSAPDLLDPRIASRLLEQTLA